MFKNILGLAFAVSLLSTGSSQGATLNFDNGSPVVVNPVNTRALSSLTGWNIYEDFQFGEDFILTGFRVSVFSQVTRTSLDFQFRIFETLPTAGSTSEHNSGINGSATTTSLAANGLIQPRPGTTGFIGYDAVVTGLSIPLDAGGYLFNLGSTIPNLLIGYSGAGGPDTPNEPNLVCNGKQRFGTGASFDYCNGGEHSFHWTAESATVVPLPGSLALLLGGLAAFFLLGHRRQSNKSI